MCLSWSFSEGFDFEEMEIIQDLGEMEHRKMEIATVVSTVEYYTD